MPDDGVLPIFDNSIGHTWVVGVNLETYCFQIPSKAGFEHVDGWDAGTTHVPKIMCVHAFHSERKPGRENLDGIVRTFERSKNYTIVTIAVIRTSASNSLPTNSLLEQSYSIYQAYPFQRLFNLFRRDKKTN